MRSRLGGVRSSKSSAEVIAVRRLAALLSGCVLAAGCTLAPQPDPAGPSTGPWSIASNGAPVHAGEDVRIVLTYRPWGSRPVPNRVDFYAVCMGCPGVLGAPVDSAISGFFLLTPEQCSEASRNGPGPDSAVCWSVPINFPYAGRWRFTTPLDVDLMVGAGSSPATPTRAADASVCGRLVVYNYDGNRHYLTLEVASADQTLRSFDYQLVGPGTLPADLAEQFGSRTPQLLFISGTFDTGPGRPMAITSFLITRMREPCPTTR